VLRGFEEVKLAVGTSATVTMNLSAREIRSTFLLPMPGVLLTNLPRSIWNVVTQAWVRPLGTFTVTVGASIRDNRLTGTF
jgi:beta-glucosidase